MRRLFIAAMLCAPFAAFAAGSCEFEAPRNLQLDLAGVRSVQIDVNSHDLHLIGGADTRGLTLVGRACASKKAALDKLTVTQRRDGDVRGVQELRSTVGSGDLHVRQIAGKFATSVGSGDVDASDVGSLQLGSVGSGDFKIDGVKGDASIGSIGSGDVTLRNVGGSVHADTLGSGDLTVRDVGGDLTLGAKGSGDVDHSGIKGKVSVPHDDD